MQNKNLFLRRAAAAIAALFTLSFTGCGQTPIDSGSLPVSGVVSENPVSDSEQTAGVTEDGSFTIHFIDVGQADSALVTCDGHYMLIDGGNVDDSDLVYSVLERETNGHLDYVVGTHAHEDHIGGLSGAFETVTADATFCPVTDYNSKAFRNFKQYAEEKGNGLTIPSVGDTFSLGNAEVTVIAVNSVPDDTNNTSIVLRIVYGDTSFLFTGDAEEEAEEVILQSGQDIQSTVLKVGHHGSRTSTSETFLDTVNPAYAVILVVRITATDTHMTSHWQSSRARILRFSVQMSSETSTAPLMVRMSHSPMASIISRQKVPLHLRWKSKSRNRKTRSSTPTF